MRQHLNLLGILHLVWGAIGVILGVSTLLLAAAAIAIGVESDTKRWSAIVTALMFGLCAATLLAGGSANAWAGSALRRRIPNGRLATLGLAVPNLFVLPFGTALGVYAFWVLLHDEARAAFDVEPASELPAPKGFGN